MLGFPIGTARFPDRGASAVRRSAACVVDHNLGVGRQPSGSDERPRDGESTTAFRRGVDPARLCQPPRVLPNRIFAGTPGRPTTLAKGAQHETIAQGLSLIHISEP